MRRENTARRRQGRRLRCGQAVQRRGKSSAGIGKDRRCLTPDPARDTLLRPQNRGTAPPLVRSRRGFPIQDLQGIAESLDVYKLVLATELGRPGWDRYVSAVRVHRAGA